MSTVAEAIRQKPKPGKYLDLLALAVEQTETLEAAIEVADYAYARTAAEPEAVWPEPPEVPAWSQEAAHGGHAWSGFTDRADFAHDIFNRDAQGVLNRAMKAAAKLSASARREIARALGAKTPQEQSQRILSLLTHYRIQLANLLGTTQLASLLQGMREVARKLPPLPPPGSVAPPPPTLAPEEAKRLTDRLAPMPTLEREAAIATLPADQQQYARVVSEMGGGAPPSVPPLPEVLPGDPDGVQYPVIEEAVRELAAKNIVQRREFDRLDDASRQRAFTVAGVDADETLEKIRTAMVEEVAQGVDVEGFRQRIEKKGLAGTFLSDMHMENVLRTNVQRVFSDGQLAVLSHPIVRSGFPFASYDAIHDDRVRPDHLALETLGIQKTNYYLADDPVFQTFRPPWDYMDRCSWVPKSVKDAAHAGISHAIQWLKDGVEPADKPYVPMPEFRPPPGFQRAFAGAPLSIQLSMMLPLVVDWAELSTDASGHEHKEKGEGGGQFTGHAGFALPERDEAKISKLVAKYENAPDGNRIGQKADVYEEWRKELASVIAKTVKPPEGWGEPDITHAAWSTYVSWKKEYEGQDGETQEEEVIFRLSDHDAKHAASDSDVQAQMGRRDGKNFDPTGKDGLKKLGHIFAAKDAKTHPAELGMVGNEWHGPNPPGKGWVFVREGPHGGKIWKKGAGNTTAAPEGSPGVADTLRQVDQLGGKILEHGLEALSKIGEAGKWVKEKVQQLKDKLESRYGRKTTLAILAAGQAFGWGLTAAGAAAGVPLWVPGSSVWGAAPGIALAEAYHQAKKIKGPKRELPENPKDYFKLDTPGTMMVNVADLHNIRARTEGIANASKFMAESRAGKKDKRKPISVYRDDKTGQMTVADGNSTYNVAKNNGWKKIPIKLIGKDEYDRLQQESEEKEMKKAAKKAATLFTPEEMALPPTAKQPVAKDAGYQHMAVMGEQANHELQALLNIGRGIGSQLGYETIAPGTSEEAINERLSKPGGIVMLAPIKGPKRAIQKVETEYDGDWARLLDIGRASVAVDSIDDLTKVVKKLQGSGVKFAKKPNDRMSNPTAEGYRDINTSLVMPNGMVVELQLHLKPMLIAKAAGHKHYEVIRNIKAKMKTEKRVEMTPEELKEFRTATDESKKLYDAAWKQATGGHGAAHAELAMLERELAATLGMVGNEWHGPNPPGPGWVMIRQGVRGGKVWQKSGQKESAPNPIDKEITIVGNHEQPAQHDHKKLASGWDTAWHVAGQLGHGDGLLDTRQLKSTIEEYTGMDLKTDQFKGLMLDLWKKRLVSMKEINEAKRVKSDPSWADVTPVVHDKGGEKLLAYASLGRGATGEQLAKATAEYFGGKVPMGENKQRPEPEPEPAREPQNQEAPAAKSPENLPDLEELADHGTLEEIAGYYQAMRRGHENESKAEQVAQRIINRTSEAEMHKFIRQQGEEPGGYLVNTSKAKRLLMALQK